VFLSELHHQMDPLKRPWTQNTIDVSTRSPWHPYIYTHFMQVVCNYLSGHINNICTKF